MTQNEQWCLLRLTGGVQLRLLCDAESMMRQLFRKPPDEACRDAERNGIWINPSYGGGGRMSWDDLPESMRRELEHPAADGDRWSFSDGAAKVVWPILKALHGLLRIEATESGNVRYGQGCGPWGGSQRIADSTYLACLLTIEPGPNFLNSVPAASISAAFRDAVLRTAPAVFGHRLACLSMHASGAQPLVFAVIVPEFERRLSKTMIFASGGIAAKWTQLLNEGVGLAVQSHAGESAADNARQRGNEGMKEKKGSVADELLRRKGEEDGGGDAGQDASAARELLNQERCGKKCGAACASAAEELLHLENASGGRSALEDMFASAMKDAGADPDLIGSALAALVAKKDFEPACAAAAEAIEQAQSACGCQCGKDGGRSFEEDLLAEDEDEAMDDEFAFDDEEDLDDDEDGSGFDDEEDWNDEDDEEDLEDDEDGSDFDDEEDWDDEDDEDDEEDLDDDEDESGFDDEEDPDDEEDRFLFDDEEEDIFAEEPGCGRQECLCACTPPSGRAPEAFFASSRLQHASAPRHPVNGFASGDAGILSGPAAALAALGMQIAVSAASGRDLFDPDGAGRGLCGRTPLKTLWISCGDVRFRGERLLAGPASCFGEGGMDALAGRLVFEKYSGKRINVPFFLSSRIKGGDFRFVVVDGLFASPGEACSGYGQEVAETLGEFAASQNVSVLAVVPSDELAAGADRIRMPDAFAWQGVLSLDFAGCSPAGPGTLRIPPDWPLFRLSVAVPGDPFIKYEPVSLRRREDGVFALR